MLTHHLSLGLSFPDHLNALTCGDGFSKFPLSSSFHYTLSDTQGPQSRCPVIKSNLLWWLRGLGELQGHEPWSAAEELSGSSFVMHQKFLFSPQLCLPASPGFQIYFRVFSFGLGWVWSVYFLPCESDKPLGRMSGCLEALRRNLASASAPGISLHFWLHLLFLILLFLNFSEPAKSHPVSAAIQE